MENKKVKIAIIAVVILVLIFLAIILTVKLFNIRNNKKVTPTINVNNVIENEISNNVVNESIQNNNIVDDNANEIVENTTSKNVIVDNNNLSNSEEVSKEEIDSETMQNEEDNKAKAINIVKENWGEDSKVYFSFDSIDSNGKYIVSVRNKTTTEALAWYTVDVQKETFSIE